jgi:hypothetical protein
MDHFNLYLYRMKIKLSNQKIIQTRSTFDDIYHKLNKGKLVFQFIDMPDNIAMTFGIYDLSWMYGLSYSMLIEHYRNECNIPNFFHNDTLYVLYNMEGSENQKIIMKMDVKITHYDSDINVKQMEKLESNRRNKCRELYIIEYIQKCIAVNDIQNAKIYQDILKLNTHVDELAENVYKLRSR